MTKGRRRVSRRSGLIEQHHISPAIRQGHVEDVEVLVPGEVIKQISIALSNIGVPEFTIIPIDY